MGLPEFTCLTLPAYKIQVFHIPVNPDNWFDSHYRQHSKIECPFIGPEKSDRLTKGYSYSTGQWQFVTHWLNYRVNQPKTPSNPELDFPTT